MSVNLYEETNVITQDRGKIIVMLYDGAIKFLNQAINAIQRNDDEAKGRYILRAQDIIMELNNVLDLEAGGQVSVNLRQLYIFMWKHLNQANVKRDADMIKKVVELLHELNQGWRAVAF